MPHASFIKLLFLAALAEAQKPEADRKTSSPLRILVEEKKLNESLPSGSPFNRNLTALYDQIENERSSIYEESLDVQNEYEDHIVQTFNKWEAKVRNLPTGAEQNPRATFIAGAMASGKGHMIAKQFDLLKDFVSQEELDNRFDLDEIRKTTYSYIKAAPENKAKNSQFESGVVEDTLMSIAIKEKKNFVYDGSMRDADWFAEIFRFLHQEGYTITLIHVDVEESRLVEQIKKRNGEDERQTDAKIAVQSLYQVERSMRKLRSIPGVRYVRVKNSEEGMNVISNSLCSRMLLAEMHEMGE